MIIWNVQTKKKYQIPERNNKMASFYVKSIFSIRIDEAVDQIAMKVDFTEQELSEQCSD